MLGVAYGGQGSRVSTLSSRPDMVSGEDVLIQLVPPMTARWVARLNGQDVTGEFRRMGGSTSLVALLTGLKVGRNAIEVTAGKKVLARSVIVDHREVGPILSGPQETPFVCQTEENGLGPALDTDCTVRSIVQYYYKSSLDDEASKSETPGVPPGFRPYDATKPLPADMSQTVTSDGRVVNYIVRRELGTINRAVYQILFLHQPGQPLPNPWMDRIPGWNGRLIYVSTSAMGSVAYRQGVLEPDVWALPGVAQGYAVATSTQNIFGVTANAWRPAETLSMVKEHFIKKFGVPTHTIGLGFSGGTIQQHLIAQNYPGLLDGLVDITSFPDIITTVPQASSDCALLEAAFDASTHTWAEEEKTAVTGFATWRTCAGYVALFGLSYIKPLSCSSAIPRALIYDPTTNPTGARCDLYSTTINLLGKDPRTGFARRPLSNVGVQYGLVAFDRGQIDAEAFIELNARIGGYDEDGNIVAKRMEADSDAVRLAYHRGLVLTGRGLSEVPIIDANTYYTDDFADVHDHFRALVIRARLIADNGTAANQVIIVNGRSQALSFLPKIAHADAERAERQEGALVRSMDVWMDNIEEDDTVVPQSTKVVRNKPLDLMDSCWATSGERIVERASYDGGGRCNQMYPAHGDPRLAAGAPLTDDILKCALKPIDPSDYVHPLNADQLERLGKVFPMGVCDYSRLGVGQHVNIPQWPRYGVP